MDDYRPPNAVTSEEIDQKTIRVVFVCEGIEVGTFGGKKNADVIVDYGETSLCMTAHIHAKGKKGAVKYKKVIKKLPGTIDKDKCSYKVKKDQVIVELKKKEEKSWAVQLSTSGLDQASSEESD